MDDFHSFLTTYSSSIIRTSSLELSYFKESYYEPNQKQIDHWTSIMTELTKYVKQHRQAVHDYFMHPDFRANFDDVNDRFSRRGQIRRKFEIIRGVYSQKDLIQNILGVWIKSKPSVKRLQMVDFIGWFFLTCFERAKSLKLGKQQDRVMALGIYFFFYPKEEEIRAPWTKELLEILQINEILTPIDLRGFPDLGVILDAYKRRSNSFWISVQEGECGMMTRGLSKQLETRRTQTCIWKEFWHVFVHSKVPRAAHVMWPRQFNFLNNEPRRVDLPQPLLNRAVQAMVAASASVRDVPEPVTEFFGQRRFDLLSLDSDRSTRFSRVLNNHEVTAWCMLSVLHSYGNSPQSGFVSLLGPLEDMIKTMQQLNIYDRLFRYDHRLWNMVTTCRIRLNMMLERMRDPKRVHFFGSMNSPACAFNIRYGETSIKAFFGSEDALIMTVPVEAKGQKFGQSGGTTIPEVTLPDDEDEEPGSLMMLLELCWKDALRNGK